MSYQEFIENKAFKVKEYGFEIEREAINSNLFEYQKDITQMALKKARYAVFADCGLGKTLIQLEWARFVFEKTNKPVLILAPLEVCVQTVEEAKKFDCLVPKICACQDDIINGVNITNYEKLAKFETKDFSGVVLDESSIIKSFTGKTKRLIFDKFKDTHYKLACTATPSPNDHMELLNHCDFLGIMKSNEALACWFINDTMHFGNYRLKQHAVSSFFEFVSSWAVSINQPSDLGYCNDGFILPELKINEIIVESEAIPAEGCLIHIPEALNATNFNKEKRNSLQMRIQWIANKVNNSTEQFLVWCETNEEGDLLSKALNDCFEIRGSTSENVRIDKVGAFKSGALRVLISKPSIFGFGLNFQNCHNVIFCGLSFSYESFYQALKRFHRFGQKHAVNVDVVIGENEKNILEIVKQKQKQHKELVENMQECIKNHQSLEFGKGKEYTMEYTRQEVVKPKYTMINGDCIEEIKTMKDESVDFILFSPPFSSLYIYSDSYRDMGNNSNDEEFFKHFKFLIPELKRILTDGRLVAVHCKQLVDYKNSAGKAGLRDFRGEIIRAFKEADFSFHSEAFIWKDPVIEMQRTKAHGLLYKQLRADSSYSRVGLPEYLLLFRKWAEVDKKPINWKTKDNFPLDKWQDYASPCWVSARTEEDEILLPEHYYWDDIIQTNVLNKDLARESKDEKHICPLQLDVIKRAVEMWSNPDDVVFSPFAGIGSEGYESLKLGRKFYGIELKESYYNQAVKNLDSASVGQQNTLFDLAQV